MAKNLRSSTRRCMEAEAAYCDATDSGVCAASPSSMSLSAVASLPCRSLLAWREAQLGREHRGLRVVGGSGLRASPRAPKPAFRPAASSTHRIHFWEINVGCIVNRGQAAACHLQHPAAVGFGRIRGRCRGGRHACAAERPRAAAGQHVAGGCRYTHAPRGRVRSRANGRHPWLLLQVGYQLP